MNNYAKVGADSCICSGGLSEKKNINSTKISNLCGVIENIRNPY
jgi:hypothetical protein